MKYGSTRREERSKWTNLKNVLDVQMNILLLEAQAAKCGLSILVSGTICLRPSNSYYTSTAGIPTRCTECYFLGGGEVWTDIFEQISLHEIEPE